MSIHLGLTTNNTTIRNDAFAATLAEGNYSIAFWAKTNTTTGACFGNMTVSGGGSETYFFDIYRFTTSWVFRSLGSGTPSSIFTRSMSDDTWSLVVMNFIIASGAGLTSRSATVHDDVDTPLLTTESTSLTSTGLPGFLTLGGRRTRTGTTNNIVNDTKYAYITLWNSHRNNTDIVNMYGSGPDAGDGVDPYDIDTDNIILYTRDSLTSIIGDDWTVNGSDYAISEDNPTILEHSFDTGTETETETPYLSVVYPILQSGFDVSSLDTSIADYRTTRLKINNIGNDVTKTQWEVFLLNEVPNNSFTITTDNTTVANGSILDGNISYLDYWFPPNYEAMAMFRTYNGSWSEWSEWKEFTALGYVNSYEKYQILNRQSTIIITPPKKKLTGFKALSELNITHYSFPLSDSWITSDNDALQIARITGAVSLSAYSYTEESVTSLVELAIKASKLRSTPVKIGINYSVWHYVFQGSGEAVDAEGEFHDAELALLDDNLTTIKGYIDAALTGVSNPPTVGAIIYDCEIFDITGDETNDNAVINKYNLAYNKAKEIFPSAKVIWFGFGTYVLSGPNFVLTTDFPYSALNNGASASLYYPTVPSVNKTILQLTANSAVSNGVETTTPWISLDSGYSESNVWSFDIGYQTNISWQIGYDVSKNSYVDSVVFYPSYSDTRVPDIKDHLLAYFRGFFNLQY